MPETWSQLLHRQHGIFTLGQAAGHGVSRNLVRQRERDGLYTVVAPRVVYAGGAIPLSRQAQLWRAVLAFDDAVLSHTTAADIHGLRVPKDDAIHVTVQRADRCRRDGVHIHTTVDPLAQEDRTTSSALPVTTLERSLIDAHAILESADDRRTMVAEAFRKRRTTSERLSQAVLRIAHIPRRAELLRMVDLAIGGSQSSGEARLYEFMARWSLPIPVRQYPLALPGGRRYVDCALPAYKIALEYYGRYHLTDAQRHDDQMRDEALRRLQWLTIRVSDRRLRDERRLAADIRANIVEQTRRLLLDR